jgi:cyclopropane-fatty-acyl-phospholipid synthase
MTENSGLTQSDGAETAAGGLFGRLAARLIPPIAAGRLTVELPSGARLERSGPGPGPDVTVSISRWRALRRLALGGDVGFAASYLDGDWSTPDLVQLFELFMLNEAEIGPSRPSAPARLFARLRHGRRRNTRRGSRRNIAEHYDLGNAFYMPWLDEGMTYSSALFSGGETLEQAQSNKIEQIAALLDVKGGERVLEIGCGWGALAERLIRRHGCHVTGITLSEEQFAYAIDRLRPEIQSGKGEIRLQDYRDIGGLFHRIVSVEMFEAVGEAYWHTYFDALKRRLVDGGSAVLQIITIAEQRFAAYRRSPDFIQRYIFPGGMLPTKSHLHELAAQAGFLIAGQLSFGDSYARTLAEWRKRFRAAWPGLESLGFDQRFQRMWDYYLAYCEVGFRTGVTDVTMYQLKRVG